MRRHILHKYCEICWREDRIETEVTDDNGGFSEEINGKQLDICAEHEARIPLRLLMVTLDEYGIDLSKYVSPKPEKQKKPPKPVAVTDDAKLICDFPGCNEGPDGGPYKAKNPQGRGAHKRSRHGVVGAAHSGA